MRFSFHFNTRLWDRRFKVTNQSSKFSKEYLITWLWFALIVEKFKK